MILDNILENIYSSMAVSVLTEYDFRNCLILKTDKIVKEFSKISRLTNKKIMALAEIFENEGKIFISIAPQWGGHQEDRLRMVKYNPTAFVDAIVHRHTMGFSKELATWHKELKKSDIFNDIDKIWNKKDSEILKLIYNNYSDAHSASEYIFSLIFKNDDRYNMLYKHYYNKLEDKTEHFKDQIEVTIESDIIHKFLTNYLDIKSHEENLSNILAVKKCKKLGIYYVEHFHAPKYWHNHLYLPYCELVSGWTIGNSYFKSIITRSINEKEALLLLEIFCNVLEGIPSVKDWDSPIYLPDNVAKLHDIWIDTPYATYFKDKYGDFRAALLKSNIITEASFNSKYGIMCIALDGHFCRSMAEQRIDNWLYKNNIAHEVEPVYPRHDEFNKSGRMRADWKIGNDYVEYFGLPDDKEYFEKMKKKRNLAKKLNISLIEIFYSDLIEIDKSLSKKIKT
jgi:hypothetical protein